MFFGFAILSSCAVLFSGAGEVLRQSEKPSEYIALVFSILAASIFAIISILGDPGNLLRGGGVQLGNKQMLCNYAFCA